MVLKLFTQPNCPKCPAAKTLVHQLAVNSKQLTVEEFDVSTIDGLAEASFYTVMATPTILLCDDKGKVIKDWRGEIPSLEEITSFLS